MMKQTGLLLFFFLVSLLVCTPAMAGSSEYALKGQELGIFWAVPFAGILLSLAFMPIFVPNLWHSHYGKIGLLWSLGVIFPLLFLYGFNVALYEISYTYLHHYVPFIIFIMALYTVSGGICLDLDYEGTPLNNTILLVIASLIASWIGTTGAAMLFIRPLLKINKDRAYKTHTVIFFIFLVCNIGGSLTALGDPPLFLGFLNGIDFFWPMFNLFFPFVTVSAPLIVIYFLLDTFYYRKEGEVLKKRTPSRSIAVSGRVNFYLLLGVISAVLLSGFWKSSIFVDVFGVHLYLQDLIRDGLLIILAYLSWKLTKKEYRRANDFSWEPLLEVAKLFASIFITAAPVIAILKAGNEGVFSGVVSLLEAHPQYTNAIYFWLTGILSGFLDNAPTYLVFFNLAGGDPVELMGVLNCTLIAISAGSVFMGALTYIGNAPNFMIKAIAEENGIQMPGFFGYMGWSFAFLIPLFLVLMSVFLC